jgi:hypothetical protein
MSASYNTNTASDLVEIKYKYFITKYGALQHVDPTFHTFIVFKNALFVNVLTLKHHDSACSTLYFVAGLTQVR